MDRFEYKIFNKSEAGPTNPKKNWLDVLNDHGKQGWQVLTSIANNSYLMMRKIEEAPKVPVKGTVGELIDLDMKSIY